MRNIWVLLVVFLVPLVEAQTITFYTNRADLIENGEFSRWTREFKKIKPKITVEVLAVERYNQEMSTRVSKGDYGDVLLIPQSLPKFAWSNYFLPLDDVVSAQQIYFGERWRYSNKNYALPIGVNVEGLIYNKKIFSRLNLAAPTTLDELYAAAEKIKAARITPLALNIGAAWPLQQWDKAALLIARDGNYFAKFASEDKPFEKNKPYGQSLSIARKFYDSGYSEVNITRDRWHQSKQEFARGELAMLFMGSWLIPQLFEAGAKEEEVGFIPFPATNDGKAAALLNVDWGLAINKKTPNPLSSKAWLRFLLFESDYADVSGFLPTLKTREPALAQLKELIKTDVRLIQMAEYDEQFLRLANKTGLDFLQGNSVRNILINPDFDFTLEYWNQRWQLAKTKVKAAPQVDMSALFDEQIEGQSE